MSWGSVEIVALDTFASRTTLVHPIARFGIHFVEASFDQQQVYPYA